MTLYIFQFYILITTNNWNVYYYNKIVDYIVNSKTERKWTQEWKEQYSRKNKEAWTQRKLKIKKQNQS